MEKPEGDFLKGKYWGKPEFRDAVEETIEKEKRLTNDEDFEVSQKPGEQIPHYLERIEKIAGRHGKLLLETSLYPKYVIKQENISGEYIKGILLGNFAESRGYERDDLKNEEVREHILAQFKQESGKDFVQYQIPEDEQERIRSMVTTDQKARMRTWLEYLTSEEAKNVPAAFRYWAFAEMLKLGSFDEERKVFNKRTENTAASFPEIDQQALSLVFDEIESKQKGEPSKIAGGRGQTEFKKILRSEDFGKLYAFALEHVRSLRLPTERLIITDGKWRHFPKGTRAKELTDAIEGFNTKWCIAGAGYAQSYLSKSDIWVYFSEDADGGATIPRACIVDSGQLGITEVRGIMSDENAKQHLDSYITPIVTEKLKEIPSGEKWSTTMEDMKKLARIHFKHLQKEPLDKNDLIFLYEIDQPIRSSGYQRDPRIDKIGKTRNPREDAPIVLDCKPEEIAWSQSEITETTKSYIGPLFKGVFHLPLEHIYTAFSEGKVEQYHIGLGGSTKDERKTALEAQKTLISPFAHDLFDSEDFEKSLYDNTDAPKEQWILKKKEQADLVRLTVKDLGFPNGATTDEIYRRAEEFEVYPFS